jgi:hypothetical protein
MSPTVNGVSWTRTAISGFNESKGESGEWDRRSAMHDSRVTPGRMVPSSGGVMTSRPNSLHEMPVTKRSFHTRTVSVFALDHNEEVHASSLSDFHSQRISVPVAEEPENLLVTLFRGFLLW